MTTNREWLYSLDVADLADWFDAEHVENQERALDGDTDALERKSADLIHEYYKPMVSELQAQVYELTVDCDMLENERDNLADDLLIANKQREYYRDLFGKCLDYADAIHALMDEGIA